MSENNQLKTAEVNPENKEGDGYLLSTVKGVGNLTRKVAGAALFAEAARAKYAPFSLGVPYELLTNGRYTDGVFKTYDSLNEHLIPAVAPAPNTKTGPLVARQIVEGLGTLVLSVGNPVTATALSAGMATVDTGAHVIRETGNLEAAQAAAVLDGGVQAVSAKLTLNAISKPGLGPIASSTALSTGLGVSADAAKAGILKFQGYDELSKQYEPTFEKTGQSVLANLAMIGAGRGAQKLSTIELPSFGKSPAPTPPAPTPPAPTAQKSVPPQEAPPPPAPVQVTPKQVEAPKPIQPKNDQHLTNIETVSYGGIAKQKTVAELLYEHYRKAEAPKAEAPKESPSRLDLHVWDQVNSTASTTGQTQTPPTHKGP